MTNPSGTLVLNVDNVPIAAGVVASTMTLML
jgi:hypothetical protein